MLCWRAYDIWYTLQVTHEDTTIIRQTMISKLQSQFSSFKLKTNVSITNIYGGVQTIQHDLIVLGVKFTRFDLVARILYFWLLIEKKILAIEEAKDLCQLKVKNKLQFDIIWS